MRKRFARLWLATVAAMSGRAADARREFTPIQQWDADPDARGWHSERSIAEAWVCAAEGALSQAISIVHDAAEQERQLGRPAWEVLLLQTATQFGDLTTAPRLAELADQIQGPRAPAAAAHAAALAAGDGDGLVDASRQYEEFGDRLAAADTAAHAVVAYQQAGLRGGAMTASATAQRLAAECQGAQTPALAAAAAPQLFTVRQREIISLAAQGLSNKRSPIGSPCRSGPSRTPLPRLPRVGARGREQLISMLRGC